MNRYDGYYNTVVGHGMRQRDPYMSYRYSGRNSHVTFEEASDLFTYNGIARKIIKAPADEAVRAGFELRDGTTPLLQDADIQSVLEDLRVQEVFSAALAWDRLYGGAAILMLVNDGGTLEDPLNEEQIKAVEGLEVFEPPEIQVHESYYYDDPYNPNYGKPEFYTLIGYNGNSFLVHESRLLVFKGGIIPTQKRRMRDGWGGKVLDELRENLLQYSAGNSLALMALSRMSQGILKLDGLTNNLENEETEKFVQARLQLIDMVRHLMNTIAIDKEDDYDLKNMSLAGVKEIIEQFETALSAASDIPVTVLFGRSPGGLNSTGKADMENYYNLVRRIQERVLKPKLVRLIDLLQKAKAVTTLPEHYVIEFKPLWLPTEKEQAEVESLKAQASEHDAGAIQHLVDIGAISAEDARETVRQAGRIKVGEGVEDRSET